MEKPASPCCTFGVLTDVQHADVDDGYNYQKTCMRYYRHALQHLNDAVSAFSSDSPVDFVLQLGDIIDGAARRKGTQVESKKTLDSVLTAFQPFHGPVYHIWGNHELYNFNREELLKSSLCSASQVKSDFRETDKSGGNFYDFIPKAGFRVVCLDQYEISMLGYSNKQKEYIEGERIMRAINKNTDPNSPTGLEGSDRRFTNFSGAISRSQFEWLERVLSNSDQQQEKVLVIGHIPIYVESSYWLCLCWDSEVILEVLQRHPSVKAYFAGHDHDGGYAVDETGIHHLTLPAIVESPPGTNCYGIVSVYPDRLYVKGVGRLQSLEMIFRSDNQSTNATTNPVDHSTL